MPDNIRVINAIITNLDQLTVQGAHNMKIVLESIQMLVLLKRNLTEPEKKEGEQPDVQDQTE